MLTQTQMIISIAIALTLGGALAYLFWKQRKEAKELMEQHEKAKTAPPATQPLQLQAYERLILDAIHGDPVLFTRSDEIERLWEIIDPVLKGWGTKDAPPVVMYKQKTWGPAEADELLAKDNHAWHLS